MPGAIWGLNMIVLLLFLLLVLVLVLVVVAVTVPGKPVEVEAQTAPRTKDLRELRQRCVSDGSSVNIGISPIIAGSQRQLRHGLSKNSIPQMSRDFQPKQVFSAIPISRQTTETGNETPLKSCPAPGHDSFAMPCAWHEAIVNVGDANG